MLKLQEFQRMYVKEVMAVVESEKDEILSFLPPSTHYRH
jgi:hypothetical protein